MDHAESTRIQYPARIAWNSRFLTLSRSGVTLESSFLPADNANFAVFAGRLREWREICCIRVVPSLALGLVWLLWVVANRANFAVLAPDLGEMRGICSVRGQFLSSSDPGKTPLPVRIARNLHHSWVSLANGAKFAQFTSNPFYLSAKD